MEDRYAHIGFVCSHIESQVAIARDDVIEFAGLVGPAVLLYLHVVNVQVERMVGCAV